MKLASAAMSLTPDSVLLTDRVAVVTGAAQGIGAAIATAFARFGADVAVCDRDADGLDATVAAIVAAGRRANRAVLDVRDGDAVRAWIEPMGDINVLVNNAGGGFQAAFLDVNDKGQDSLVRENFTSVTNFIRACTPKMPSGGSIINVTSIEAHRAAPGLRGLLRDEGRGREPHEDARARVRRPARPRELHRPGRDPHARHRRRAGQDAAAVRRCTSTTSPRAAVYLASDWSRFVTGTTIHVDGGNLAAGGWGRSNAGGYTTAGDAVDGAR